MNDHIRLDLAARICGTHVLGGLGVFALFDLMSRIGAVSVESSSVPMLMAFGWLHFTAGLAILAVIRSWSLKRTKGPSDTYAMPILIAGAVIGVGLVFMGGFIDLWLCAVILSGYVA